MVPHRFSRRSCRFTWLFGAAALVVLSVAANLAAQPNVPRFERGGCLVDGEWARSVQRECGWLVVSESRGRARSNTVRLAVEIFRATQPSAAPPLVLLHRGPGRGGIRTYSPGVAKTAIVRERDVVIYDQRGAGFSQPKLCPA
jgi:hypothetical protein